jgi:hypothetical protein
MNVRPGRLKLPAARLRALAAITSRRGVARGDCSELVVETAGVPRKFNPPDPAAALNLSRAAGAFMSLAEAAAKFAYAASVTKRVEEALIASGRSGMVGSEQRRCPLC